MKKCVYCKKEIDKNCVVDFCENCGKRVWGEKMFNAIIKNMEKARDSGNLYNNIPFDMKDIRKLF